MCWLEFKWPKEQKDIYYRKFCWYSTYPGRSQTTWPLHIIYGPVLGGLFYTSRAGLLNLLLHILFELLYPVVSAARCIVVVVCGASAAPEVLMSTLVSTLSSWNSVAIDSVI